MMNKTYRTENITFCYKDNNNNEIAYSPTLERLKYGDYAYVFKPMFNGSKITFISNGQLKNEFYYNIYADKIELELLQKFEKYFDERAKELFNLYKERQNFPKSTKDLDFWFDIDDNVINFVPVESTVNGKFYAWTFTPILNNNDLIEADYVIDNMCAADVDALKQDYYIDVFKDTLTRYEYNQLKDKLKQVAKDLCNSIFNANGKLMYDDVNDRFIAYNSTYDCNGCLIGA